MERKTDTPALRQHRERVEIRITEHTRVVRAMAADGCSDIQIAAHLDLTRKWVAELRRRADIPSGFLRVVPSTPRAVYPSRFDLEDSGEL